MVTVGEQALVSRVYEVLDAEIASVVDELAGRPEPDRAPVLRARLAAFQSHPPAGHRPGAGRAAAVWGGPRRLADGTFGTSAEAYTHVRFREPAPQSLFRPR